MDWKAEIDLSNWRGMRYLLNGLDLLLWAGLLALAIAAALYHFNVASFPYQLYLTEGGDLQSVRALQRGLNPWSPELAPEFANLYGIGYPWVVALCSRLAPGMSVIVLMRLVSAGAIFLGLGAVFVALRQGRASVLVAAAAAIAVYSTMLFSVDTLGARPDAAVVALLLLSAVSALQPGLGAALGAGALAASAYYFKPTGLLALAVVTLLLAMQMRWRHAAASLIAGLGVFVALTVWMLWRYPYFFEATFFLHLGARSYSVAWLWAQWQNLFRFNLPWVLTLGLALLWPLGRRQSVLPPGPWRLWAAGAVLVLAALVSGPGAHTGSWLDYYNQLLLPFLFLAGALWLQAIGVHARWVALGLILNAALVLGVARFYVPPITAEQVSEWDRVDAWVAAHPYGMYPPMLTSISARHGGFIADNDHSHGLDRCRPGHQLKESNAARNLAIMREVQAGAFQSVICGGNWLCPDSSVMRAMGYVVAAEFHPAAIHKRGVLDLTAWVPKKAGKH